MITHSPVSSTPSPRLRWQGASVGAFAALVLALLPGVVAPAAAAPADGTVRTFDDEPLGQPPADCRTIGDVSVADAAFGGAAETNRAMRIVDQDPAVYTRAWCDYPQSEERSVSYRFSPAQLGAGPYVAIQGAEGTSANGVWRFTFNRTGDDIRIDAYDGSSFATVGTITDGAILGEWVDVTINATTERAEIIANGVRFETDRRNAPSPTMGEIYFGSAGASSVGVDYYIDDLAVTDQLPDDAFAGIQIEPLVDPFLPDGEVTDEPVARFRLPDGATVEDLTVETTWQDSPVPTTLSDPDGDGWVTVTMTHVLVDGDSGVLRTVVTDAAGTESLALQSLSVRSQTRPDVVIAEGDGDERPFFPEVASLDDGRLVTVYYWANEHSPGSPGGEPGQIRWTESTDGGLTWSEPRVIIDTPEDDRDPQITQLRDGTIILTWFQTDWTGHPTDAATITGTYVARSEDGGATWSDPLLVESSMSCGCGPRSGHYYLGWSAESGNVIELEDGDLLVPLYGTRPDAPLGRASVVRSTDGGRTWPVENEVMLPAEPGVGLSETEVADLGDGHVTAVIRPGMVSDSYDGGRTWTEATPVPWSMQAPDLLTLPGGELLLTYGGSDYGSNEPVIGRLARGEEAWTDTEPVLLYLSRQNVDQGDPSSAIVEEDRYLTVSYDTNIDAVVGTFSSASDYPGEPEEPEEPEPVPPSPGRGFFLNDGWDVWADHEFSFGRPGDSVVVGDWDGDGTDTLGVRRGNAYYLSTSLYGGNADVELRFGRASDTVLVGDWDGDGADTFAVRRGNAYFLSNSLTGGNAEVELNYGRAGDEVLVGDWDGDGADTFAVRRGNTYFLSNSLGGGNAELELNYGRASDAVLMGDWDGDGADTFAVRRGNTYLVANTFSRRWADLEVNYGRAGDEVFVGDWDGDGTDTLGVRR